MKYLLMIAIICLSVQFANARPDYTNGQWYVWTSEATAQMALDYINNDSGVLPIYEKRRGKINTNKISTVEWVEAIQELKDGRWGFLRISEALLDDLKTPEAQRELFWTAFKPTAVVVTSDMIKTEESE